MGQKLELRKFILANTTPFFGSNFHVQTEKKQTKQNKTTIKKNRNACCQAIIVQAKKRTRECMCMFILNF